MNSKTTFIENFLYYSFVIITIFLGFKLLPLLFPFVGGLLLAYIFNHISAPLVRVLNIKLKAVTVLIAIFFYLTIILGFAGLVTVIGSRIVEFASIFPSIYSEQLMPISEQVASEFITFLNKLSPALTISVEELFTLVNKTTAEVVTGLSASILTTISGWIKTFPIFLIGFVFMIICSFYISLEYKSITGFLMKQLPKRFRAVFLEIKDFVLTSLLKLLKAYIILMAITFIELSVGLWALRINEFYKIAAVIAVLDLLPLIGSGGVLIPWGIYNLIIGDVFLGSSLLLLYGVVATMRNILEPKIVGEQLGLHPVVALTAMFIGIKSLGLGGIIVAPVTVLIIRHLNQKGIIRLYRT